MSSSCVEPAELREPVLLSVLRVHHKRVRLRHVNGAAGVFNGHQLVGTAILSASSAALRVFSRASACSGTIPRDRKSTRLNSSHVKISYAVFCLKKKNKKNRA